jgi:curved DNA-binding protein CbpA
VDSRLDPYEILQVSPDADDSQITAGYRALARRYHPDLAGDQGTATMIIINQAWEMLRDPKRRAAYDRTRPRAVQHRFEATEPDGTGAAGPPPGRPSGTVLTFGRHLGWSIGEVARFDPGYLEWLEDRREGTHLRDEIHATLLAIGWRQKPEEPRRRRA